MKSIFIIGAGPGIGTSVACRFGREGMAVGVIARSTATTSHAQAALRDAGVQESAAAQADAADEKGLTAALDSLTGALGTPQVVVYNAARIKLDSLFGLSHAERQACHGVNVLGALTTLAYVVPKMLDAGGGTLLLTCGMPEPHPQLLNLSIDKAGLRAAAAAVWMQYGQHGLHVATVTIGGAVAPGTRYNPQDIAERYWQLHAHAPTPWSPNVDYTGNPDKPEVAIEIALKQLAGR